ncbi:unnamed protein product [Scytosiphon promiscuus]
MEPPRRPGADGDHPRSHWVDPGYSKYSPGTAPAPDPSAITRTHPEPSLLSERQRITAPAAATAAATAAAADAAAGADPNVTETDENNDTNEDIENIETNEINGANETNQTIEDGGSNQTNQTNENNQINEANQIVEDSGSNETNRTNETDQINQINRDDDPDGRNTDSSINAGSAVDDAIKTGNTVSSDSYPKANESDEGIDDEDRCPICRDELPGVHRGIVKCGHVFCFSCIHKWVKRQKNSCPVCRADITSIKKTLSEAEIAEKNRNWKPLTKAQRKRANSKSGIGRPPPNPFVRVATIRVRKKQSSEQIRQPVVARHPHAPGIYYQAYDRQAMLTAVAAAAVAPPPRQLRAWTPAGGIRIDFERREQQQQQRLQLRSAADVAEIQRLAAAAARQASAGNSPSRQVYRSVG